MNAPKPIKRHTALQPLSREHHHGLLLCWKIRKGLANGTDEKRIKKYADWFFDFHLLPHFEVEEKYVFPLLEAENSLVKKAYEDHQRIKELFSQKNDLNNTLHAIQEELDNHIRFEERILFNSIQDSATIAALASLENTIEENKFCEIWEDQFWKE